MQRQKLSGTAKAMRDRSMQGSVMCSGELNPPCPPQMIQAGTLAAMLAGTIQPMPPITASACWSSASSCSTGSSPLWNWMSAGGSGSSAHSLPYSRSATDTTLYPRRRISAAALAMYCGSGLRVSARHSVRTVAGRTST
ncbi:hypothetical protein D3C80_1770060 [compost metagenome]